jgi:hypothetical protein
MAIAATLTLRLFISITILLSGERPFARIRR